MIEVNMHLIIRSKGIVEIKPKGSFAKLFCKHIPVTGEHCSPTGLTRISGQDIYTICEKCGKVIDSNHINY